MVEGPDVRPLRPRATTGRPRVPRLAIVAAIAVPVLIVVGNLVNLWTELLWFAELDQRDVLVTRIKWSLTIGAIAGAVAFAYLLAHALVAVRIAKSDMYIPFLANPEAAEDGPDQPVLPAVVMRPIAIAASLLVSILAGLAMGNRWEVVLQFVGREQFGVSDPAFGRDISFYLFTMPFLELLVGFLQVMTVVAAILVALMYVGTGVIRYAPVGRVAAPAIGHGSVLLGIFFLLQAARTMLARWGLVSDSNGYVTGVGATDGLVRSPAMLVTVVVALLIAGWLFYNARTRNSRGMGIAVGVYIAVSIVATNLIPAAVQQFVVSPNELDRERNLIENNIEFTRLAYGLDNVIERSVRNVGDLSPQQIAQATGTTENVRIWSPAELLLFLRERQSFRQYYGFNSPDIDRYMIDGRYRQVMVAPRELQPDRVPPPNTWIRERLKFTHGYGVTMSYVNEADPQGLPVNAVEDIPPRANADIEVTRPEIYFGEDLDGTGAERWVIANTATTEFDYPQASDDSDGLAPTDPAPESAEAGGAESEAPADDGGGDGGADGDAAEAEAEAVTDAAGAETRYAGDGGIQLDGTMRRLAFALRFRDYRMLFNQDIRDESRLIFRSDIRERVQELAPFLTLDADPYVTVVDGRLVWILDAYTTSERFPFSSTEQEIESPDIPASLLQGGGERFNYWRNSVKATVDAYDGDVTLYVVDEEDPVVATWRNIFPSLFESADKMPKPIRDHLRYPEDLFNIQTSVWATYHMNDPEHFFNREDRWEFPVFGDGTEQLVQAALYVLGTLPGQRSLAEGDEEDEAAAAESGEVSFAPPAGRDAEMLLIRPTTPVNRPNMIGWIAARMDGANYGQIVSLRLPNMTTGPAQAVGFIDKEPAVQEFVRDAENPNTTVQQGDLFVLPIGTELVHVQPYFVLSRSNNLPELANIGVVYETTVGWAPTFTGAMKDIFEQRTGREVPEPSDEPAPDEPTDPGAGAEPAEDLDELVQQAADTLAAAEECQRTGDWACYGDELERLGELLTRADELAGGADEPS